MIPQRPFGRTNHLSTRTIFGAVAVGTVTQDDADRTLDLLLEYGINHIDTAASYGDSELRVGKWMDRHRQDFFLATKTEKRTYREAREEFHRSLERLRVSSVDLIQLHFLIDPQEWEIAMGPGGVLEYLLEARDQGLTRFIGVTGHEITVAAMHMRSLERFDFDSVLLPYSYILMQNPRYAADFNALVTLCKARSVAVQTIKSIARGGWSPDQTKTSPTWYQPLNDASPIEHAVHWVLANPDVFLNTVGDIHILPKVLDAARCFEARPSDEVMQADVEAHQMTPLFV